MFIFSCCWSLGMFLATVWEAEVACRHHYHQSPMYNVEFHCNYCLSWIVDFHCNYSLSWSVDFHCNYSLSWSVDFHCNYSLSWSVDFHCNYSLSWSVDLHCNYSLSWSVDLHCNYCCSFDHVVTCLCFSWFMRESGKYSTEIIIISWWFLFLERMNQYSQK
jgi:hypothetical protein